MLGKLLTIFIVFTSINGWVLDVSHQHVTPNLTYNVTILCHNKVNDQNTQKITKPKSIEIKKVIKIPWYSIASMYLGDQVVKTNYLKYATTTGNVDTPTSTYIKIVYNIANSETVGKYRCIVSGEGQNIRRRYIKTNLAVITENRTPVEMTSVTTISLTTTQVTTTPVTKTPVPIYWPQGIYTLWKPRAGCPNTTTSTWAISSLRISTARSDNNDSSSSSLHLSGKVFKKIDNNNYVTIEMCSQTTVGNGPVWPKGSYCVQAYSQRYHDARDCPDELHWGFTTYARYNDGFKDRHINLPYRYYTKDYSFIFYCCRVDGKPTDQIILPTFHPFYLFRYGGRCQEVVGMEVSNEWIHTDTVKSKFRDQYWYVDKNGWKSGHKNNPDGSIINGVTTQICFYTPRD